MIIYTTEYLDELDDRLFGGAVVPLREWIALGLGGCGHTEHRCGSQQGNPQPPNEWLHTPFLSSNEMGTPNMEVPSGIMP